MNVGRDVGVGDGVCVGVGSSVGVGDGSGATVLAWQARNCIETRITAIRTATWDISASLRDVWVDGV